MKVKAASICRHCWYYSDECTSVCTNDRSVHYQDYVMDNQSCPYYEEDERKVKSQAVEFPNDPDYKGIIDSYVNAR